jgi:hypothetical protein
MNIEGRECQNLGWGNYGINERSTIMVVRLFLYMKVGGLKDKDFCFYFTDH